MSTAREYNTTTPHLDPTDPRTIDWAARQARALVPFDVVGGLPINPLTTDLPEGRGGLWHWGEAVAVDAAVLSFGRGSDRSRCLLMIERTDGHGWALPGGMLDPGESPRQAMAREVGEETTLRVDHEAAVMWPPRAVPDPRAGANAWMVTVPFVIPLFTRPTVRGMDDARLAAWMPAEDFTTLTAALGTGRVFPAHVELIREVLAR